MMKLETIGPRKDKVWIGGSGETLLLLHGAWGGAEMHLGKVWEALAQRFRVVAPELPGVGDPAAPWQESFDAYGERAAEILQLVDGRSPFCVGNSFGAAVAWQAAARIAKCWGVVLVNGVPPPAIPGPVHFLVGNRIARRLLRPLFRKINFSPSVAARGFADPENVPPELGLLLADPPTQRLDALLAVLFSGTRPAPPPNAPILLLWGEADRLPGTGADAGRRLSQTLRAKLAMIPRAGHCPQIERPKEFVDALLSLTAAST
jgi:2-hydroxy-6-oxonona-2,4-dienedioate hydrolase